MKSKIHAGSFNKVVLKSWDTMQFLSKVATVGKQKQLEVTNTVLIIITLLSFFTWFAVKKTPKCRADMQRKPQFIYKRKYCAE